MSCHSLNRGARLPHWGWLVPGITGLFLGMATDVRADGDSGNVVAIEEDWELVVKEPDEETAAPQVTCIIAPNDDDEGVYAAFNLNHKSFPQYDAGGLHLQTWHGATPLESAQFPSDALLTTPDETITWTMRMHVQEEHLWFEVVSGSSSTWGNFGGTGTLKASVATQLTNLNQYEPNDSAANSGIGYAGNRVTSLKLKAVRKLLKSGDVVEDTETRTVYPQD
jgi:hypothetical protein